MNSKYSFAFLVLGLVWQAQAVVTSGISYHGRLLKSDGTAVASSAVQLQVQIRSSGNENCLLYSEIQTKDLSTTDGLFSLTLNDGSGVRNDSSGLTMPQVLANQGTKTLPGGACAVGTTFTPTSADGRRMVVYFNDGSFSGWEPFPEEAINFAPLAIEAQQIAGYKATNLIRGPVTSSVTELTAPQLAEFLNIINGTSAQYISSSSSSSVSIPSYTTASPPSTPVAGSFWYDSTAKQLKFYDGTSTNTVGNTTTLPASAITSGTIATARLGSGTANSTTYLRGDNTWAAPPASQWTTTGSDVYYSAGNVGVGTTTPAFPLDVNNTIRVSTSGGPGQLVVSSANNSANQAGILYLDRARGTMAAKTFALSGDTLGTIILSNHQQLTGAQIHAAATENQSFTNGGTDLLFSTTATGTNTKTVKMVLNNSGNVGIGTTTPNSELDLNGAFSVRGMAAPAVSPAGQGRIYFDSTTGTFKVSQNNGSYKTLLASDTKPIDVSSITLPAGYFSIVNNMTFNGDGTVSKDLVYSWATQAANKFFAAPNGVAGAPGFRGLVAADIPNLDVSKITSGTLPTALGGTQWTTTGSDVYYNTGNVGIGATSPQTTLQVAGVISPATNNTYTLGNATYRFTEVYATNGVINTSDRREKKDIYNTDLGLDFINKLRPITYRWNTGVDDDVHYGLIAQEAEKAIAEVGISEKTSIVTHDETTDRYGVRYSELISPLIRAIQELYNKLLGVDRDIASIKNENILIKTQAEVEKAAKDKKIENLEQENAAMKARLDKIEKALSSK